MGRSSLLVLRRVDEMSFNVAFEKHGVTRAWTDLADMTCMGSRRAFERFDNSIWRSVWTVWADKTSICLEYGIDLYVL